MASWFCSSPLVAIAALAQSMQAPHQPFLNNSIYEGQKGIPTDRITEPCEVPMYVCNICFGGQDLLTYGTQEC